MTDSNEGVDVTETTEFENVSAVTKLTDEELASFHRLTENINNGVSVLGELTVTLAQTESRKEEVVKQVVELSTQRQELVQRFYKKYGNGNINIATGEITPV